MMGLTSVQQDCLSFLKQRKDETGVVPSFQEISDHFGFKSKSRVYSIMECLEERGVVRRLRARARAVEIVPETETRSVTVSADLWAPLIRYAIAERINLETAVNQFIRDGLESA